MRKERAEGQPSIASKGVELPRSGGDHVDDAKQQEDEDYRSKCRCPSSRLRGIHKDFYVGRMTGIEQLMGRLAPDGQIC